MSVGGISNAFQLHLGLALLGIDETLRQIPTGEVELIVDHSSDGVSLEVFRILLEEGRYNLFHFVRDTQRLNTNALKVVERVLHLLVLADFLGSDVKVYLTIIGAGPVGSVVAVGSGSDFLQMSPYYIFIGAAEGALELFDLHRLPQRKRFLHTRLQIVDKEVVHLPGIRRKYLHLRLHHSAGVNAIDTPQVP